MGFGVTAAATPVLAQGIGLGIELGPRYEPAPPPAPRYDAYPHYRYEYAPRPYYYQPDGSTYGPNVQENCYVNSLNGRVCAD
ncbi:MAG: hypothetical protein ACREIP_04780 [Alphaproteobacteria bacterium]